MLGSSPGQSKNRLSYPDHGDQLCRLMGSGLDQLPIYFFLFYPVISNESAKILDMGAITAVIFLSCIFLISKSHGTFRITKSREGLGVLQVRSKEKYRARFGSLASFTYSRAVAAIRVMEAKTITTPSSIIWLRLQIRYALWIVAARTDNSNDVLISQ